MSNPIPNLLALTSIADGSPQQAAPIRNNYAAIQAAVNALATALKGGTAGSLLYATDLSDVAYLPDAPNDGDALVWNAAASRWKPVASASGAGTQLDYAQITAASTTISATTEGTANAIVTGNSITYDGSRVKVDFFAPSCAPTVSGAWTLTLVLLMDATVIGHAVWASTQGTSSGQFALKAEAFWTPAAGAHTFKVQGYITSANVNIVAGAGGAGNILPAFLRVTKA